MNSPASYFPCFGGMGVLAEIGPRARCLTRTAGAGIISVPSVVCCRGKSTAEVLPVAVASRSRLNRARFPSMNHAEGTAL
jgi:hypothetical protein